MITYNIELETSADYVYTLESVKQYDHLSRKLLVRIRKPDGAYLTDQSGYQYRFRALKPDLNPVYVPATWEDGVIHLELDRQVLSVSGDVYADFEVLNGEQVVLSSQTLHIPVEPAALGAKEIKSTPLVTALVGVSAESIALMKLTSDMAEKIKRSKANLDSLVERLSTLENQVGEAENQRASAEQIRQAKEQERQTAEPLRATAERARQTQETERQTAETQRTTAETSRSELYAQMQTLHTKVVKDEGARVETEKNRVEAEKTRVQAEAQRLIKESERLSAEETRIENEEERVGAEADRRENERQRANAYAIKHQRADQDHAKITAAMETLQTFETGQIAAQVTEIKTQKADKIYVDEKIRELVGSAPETLDTLGEIASVINAEGSKLTQVKKALEGKENTGKAKELVDALKEELKTLIEARVLPSTLEEKLALKVCKVDYERDMAGLEDIFLKKDNLTAIETLIQNATANKVDKVEGKVLSTNDYTTAEKQKLARLSETVQIDLVNNLTSTSTTHALSAAQGKVLKDMIEELKQNGDSPALLEASEVRAVQEGNDPEALDRLFAKTSKVGATFEKGLRLSNTGLAGVETFDLLLENASLRSLFLESEAGIRAIVNSRVAIQKLFTFLNKSSNNYPVLINNVRLMQAISNSDIALQSMCDMADTIQINLTNQNGFWLNILSAKKAVVKFFKHQKMAYKVSNFFTYWSSEKTGIAEHIYRMFSNWKREERELPTNTLYNSPPLFTLARPCIVFMEEFNIGGRTAYTSWMYHQGSAVNEYPVRQEGTVPQTFNSQTQKRIFYQGCQARSVTGTNNYGRSYLITYTVYLDEEE